LLERYLRDKKDSFAQKPIIENAKSACGCGVLRGTRGWREGKDNVAGMQNRSKSKMADRRRKRGEKERIDVDFRRARA